MKNVWGWMVANKKDVYNYFKWLMMLIAAAVVITGFTSCVVKVREIDSVNSYVATLNASKLREAVNSRRGDWINTCVNNGAAGVLGGATMGADAINACKNAGFELYPEQDWAAVVRGNQNPFFEQMMLDKKNESK